MTQTDGRARVVHTIPGRLRIRFEGADPAPSFDHLAAVRLAPGVLAIELKPASRSAVVRYDVTQTTQALVLTELERAGVTLIVPSTASRGTAPPPVDAVSGASRSTTERGEPAARDARGRQARQHADRDPGPTVDKGGERSALLDLLSGPPPKLDRRFAESLALSAVSLLAARRVGLALGGGTTLPAYFAIWFTLRRLTGAGRRR